MLKNVRCIIENANRVPVKKIIDTTIMKWLNEEEITELIY